MYTIACLRQQGGFVIKVWTKLGQLTILVAKYGKWLGIQNFTNPYTGKIEEYALFGQKDWSVVLAVTSDGNTLTVRQYKQGCDSVCLELPVGTANFHGDNPAELPVETMNKALLDETGYQAGQVISLGAYWIATRNSPTRFHCFLALDCKEAQKPAEHITEPIERGLMPLTEWVKQVLVDGKIDEPSAVVTTARALPHLSQFGIRIQMPS